MTFIFGFFPSKYTCDDKHTNLRDYKSIVNIRLSLFIFDIGFMICWNGHNDNL